MGFEEILINVPTSACSNTLQMHFDDRSVFKHIRNPQPFIYHFFNWSVATLKIKMITMVQLVGTFGDDNGDGTNDGDDDENDDVASCPG